MSSEIRVRLISCKRVKEFALEVAKSRAHKFSRVGGEFLLQCEVNLKQFISNYIRRLPSRGRP